MFKGNHSIKRNSLSLILMLGVALASIQSGSGPLVLMAWADNSTYESEIRLDPNITLSPDGAYVALNIPPRVYKHAKVDLSDLRVQNGKGENVPYAFLGDTPSYLESQTVHNLTAIESRRENNRDVYDFKTESTLSQDILLDGLDIWVDQTNDYLFEVIIWGSYDGLNFEQISAGTVYKVKDNRNGIIDFGQSHKYTTYRIETNQTSPTLVPVQVSGRLRTLTLKPDGFKATGEVSYPAEFSQVEKDSTTIITIADGENLPINSIAIETKSFYRRMIEVTANGTEGSEVLYRGEGTRFNLENGLLVEPGIMMARAQHRFQTLDIKIENKDDMPLMIESVRITYQPDQLVFKILPDQQYRLSYGDSSRQAPEYDLASVVENLQDLIVGEVTIGPTEEISNPPVVSKIGGSKLILNLVIIFAGLLLGFVSLVALKGNKQKDNKQKDNKQKDKDS